MEYLYEGMEEVFGRKNESRHSNNLVLISQLLIGIIVLSQNIQMFWYPDKLLGSWNKYEIFWNSSSIPSIDIILDSYNFMSLCILVVISSISLTAFFLILILALKYMKLKVPSVIIFLTKNLLMILCEVYFIAYVKILFAVIKYSSQGYQTVYEYPISNLSAFNLGIGVLNLCVILLAILLVLTTVYNATSCDIRQPLNDKITTAKSRTIGSEFKSIVSLCISFMYFFIGHDYYQTYLLSLIILYSMMTWYYIYYLPFYSELLNFFQIFFHLDCVVIVSSFWIGFLLDNAGIPFLVSMIMQLILLTVSYSILQYRIAKINKNYTAFYSKFELFELSIREWLKSGKIEEELIDYMNKNFNIYKDKLNIIIQTYYCNDVLLNDSLAYNKIIGIKYKGFNIFTNFQVYKCRKIIMGLCKASAAEGIKLFQYFTDLEKLKLDDITFCEKYSKFSQSIIEPNPNLLKLKTSIDELFDVKKLLINSYDSILISFPNSDEVNDMYGSFLINILNDYNKGQLYLNKRVKSSNNMSISKGNWAKINDRGFITFSGNIKNLGKIIYANKSFIAFTGIPPELVKTFFFSNFLSKSYSRDHNILLKHFIKNYTESTVYKSLPLFLVNYHGYLCEFFVTLECIGDKDSINFLCSIDPIHGGNRELAVIDLNGFIHSHSKDFTKVLGYDHKNAENMNIQFYIPDIIINELIIDSLYKIKQILPGDGNEQFSKIIGLVLKCCKINEITIYVLFITDDSEQLNYWKTKQDFYDIDGVNYRYFITEDNEIEEEEKVEEDQVLKSSLKKSSLAYDEKKKLVENKKNKSKSSSKTNQSRLSTHSSSSNILDNNELKAADKSRIVLKVTRALLFISVINI